MHILTENPILRVDMNSFTTRMVSIQVERIRVNIIPHNSICVWMHIVACRKIKQFTFKYIL